MSAEQPAPATAAPAQYTITEAVKALAATGVKIAPSTVRYWCQKGAIGHRVGGRYFVRRDELKKLAGIA
jgi:DNA-binding transcriptional MerR regulator